jgi:rhodanese-related sulfurtransferase
MAKEELKARLGSPDLVLIDVRAGKDWKESDYKIAGAIRENPQEVDKWGEKYPKGKTLVLYCA